MRTDGCTEAQGYLLSRPVPAVQVPGRIARLGGQVFVNDRQEKAG